MVLTRATRLRWPRAGRRTAIALIGPGAIGCCLAAALLEQGHDVAIGARQPFPRLTLVHGEITREFSAHCAPSPADLAGADLVVLATKAHQTPGARDWLAAATSNGAPVLIAQNGVDHVERLHAVLGSSDPERVPLVPAVVYLPAHRTAPGHAVLEGRASLTLPAGASAQRFADAFGQGMVRIDLVDDWLTAAWMKLLMNAVSGAISAPLGRTIYVLADPGAAELARAMIKEAVPVGRAEGARSGRSQENTQPWHLLRGKCRLVAWTDKPWRVES